MQRKLIVMLKYPQPGAVKTRLIPTLGRERACALYRAMVGQTLCEVDRLGERIALTVEARVAGAPDDAATRQWPGAARSIRSQGEGDLGERLERAVRESFADGMAAVVVIGADCPQLSVDHLSAAFSVLERNDVVLGPAADGGYYLIGLRRPVPELFRGVPWGGSEVLERTLAAARRAGVACRMLETLSDVDEAEDLPVWAETAAARERGRGGVSVIIPTLNEAHQLPAVLAAAQRSHPLEIIVADGGSTDATRVVAREADAIVLSAGRGRATQMNQAARIATGEYLLFAHADTLLPENYPIHIANTLALPGVAVGAFGFAIADQFPGRRWVERATNWRARRYELPYGDQAIFVCRDTFWRTAGYSDVPILEDYLWVRRARSLGRIVIAPAFARTSGRRWLRLGIARTIVVNQAIILGYHMGVPLPRLAAWYRMGDLESQPGTSFSRGRARLI